MMRFFTAVIILLFCLIPNVSFAQSIVWEEYATDIRISVRAKDALFIGTPIGGAHITVIDKLTGDTIAEGTTYGKAGDKDLIMKSNNERDVIITNEDTADFTFSLDIRSPTLVSINVVAPLSQKQSIVEVSEDHLLIPGKDYSSGNGLIIELPGMIVDTVTPSAGMTIDYDPENPITIIANIRKLCGCDLGKEGYWPSSRYEVEAHIYKEAAFLSVVPMQFNDNSHFAARLKMPEPGIYKIIVTAFDSQTKEGGTDETTIILSEKK